MMVAIKTVEFERKDGSVIMRKMEKKCTIAKGVRNIICRIALRRKMQ
jgi:hypothetical protein